MTTAVTQREPAGLTIEHLTKIFGGAVRAIDDVSLTIAPGELVSFLASVNYTGTSSMEIGIKVVTENIRDQVVRHANSCFFTMVAVGEDGRPVPVPPLSPSSPDEKRRWEAAIERKKLRQELQRRHDELRSSTLPG